MYRYYNANPKGRDIFDCAIRALSKATGMSWDEAYEELANAGRELGLMMDSVESIEYYLDKRYPRRCYSSMTLDEFTKEYPRGRYIVSMNGHLTSVVDGYIYDSFNPSNRRILCSWLISY